MNKEDPYKKEFTFISKDRNFIFGFPEENGRMLLARQPIYIDAENRIYDNNKGFIDYYANLSKRPDLVVRGSQNNLPQSQYQGVTKQREIYMVNGEEYEKVGIENDGNYRLKNVRTGEI